MNQIAMLLGASLWAVSLQGGDDDPIRTTLENAKVKYEQSMVTYRELSKEYFDTKEESARKQGSKKLVDQIKGEREAFEVSDELPVNAPATLRARSESALAVLVASYTQAVKEYIRTKHDTLAAATEKELIVLRAKGFPAITGVWQEGPKVNGVLVTIVQNADKFTATCTYQHKEHGEISWRMSGNISKDGQIKGTLVHTKTPSGPWKNQSRNGKFSPSNGTIIGHAEFQGGGGHDFEWKLQDN